MDINGAAVLDLRWEAGLSQVALANAAGLHKSTICRIEKGEQGASPAIAKRIATALGVPVRAILKERAS